MDKQQLLKLRKLNKEVEDLRIRIKNLTCEPKEIVIDTVNDYSTGYPHTIVIEGYGSEKYKTEKDKLCNQLIRKMIKVKKQAEEIEACINDIENPELRTMLRMRYIDGNTYEQIAEITGYSIRTVIRRLKNI